MQAKTMPSFVASFLANDLRAALRKHGKTMADVKPQELGMLLRLNYDGVIDRKTARQTLDCLLESK